jgi:hypothetical protein
MDGLGYQNRAWKGNTKGIRRIGAQYDYEVMQFMKRTHQSMNLLNYLVSLGDYNFELSIIRWNMNMNFCYQYHVP